MHTMRTKTGKTGYMAIKIDLEKAYDRISWNFLQETLLQASLPTKLVDLIMHCVTSSSTQILWNGELTEPFRPTRGLRQGCPLSPYLFVLCMERLAHLIQIAVDSQYWKPIHLNK